MVINTSAYNRLLELPEVFTDSTMARQCGYSPESAAVTLSRWKAAGLIKPLGLRTGVYFNMVANRDAHQDYFSDAVKLIYPTAVLRGESVLHATGWTTQIPQSVSIAVLQRPYYPSIKGVRICGRTRNWFVLANQFIAKEGIYGFKSLSPAFALADLYLSQNSWHPDIDDLDVDDIQWREVSAAFGALQIDVPEQYKEMVERSASMAPGTNRRWRR